MKEDSGFRRRLFIWMFASVFALTLVGAGHISFADHDDDHSQVLGPPNNLGLTKKYERLSVGFQQWRWSVIGDTGLDPFADDPDGMLCHINQSGPVWYLTGAPANPDEPVVRMCSIPAGKKIHFPIINVAWITLNPDEAEFISDPDNFQFISDLLFDLMTAEDVVLSVEINGQPVDNLRDFLVESPVFELDNFGSLEDGFLNFDTGYYLLLKPLPKGFHTIHISGESVFGPVEASYFINVVSDDEED